MVAAVTGLLEKGALATLVVLALTGQIIPKFVVEKYILAPLHTRIEALEKAMARRDEEQREVAKQQAGAIETLSRLLEHHLNKDNRGGD